MDGCPKKHKTKHIFNSYNNWKQKSSFTQQEKFPMVTYVKFWEVSEDLREAVMVVLLRELYFPHVKMPDAVDLVVSVDHCGRLPLCFG